MKYFSDKIVFNKKFNKYLLRDWMEVDGTDENYEQFKEFCEKHKIKETKNTKQKLRKP